MKTRPLALSLGIVASLPSVHSTPFTYHRREVSFNYGVDKVRGVNIGGWLVLEPWITPSLFDVIGGVAVDEYTYCQALGDKAAASMYNHWSTWITWQDFRDIKNAGLNHVRIPVGYWAFEKLPGDAYVQGAAYYVDAAIDWARSVGLKIMLDLHGAPGSQNGFDNSGRRGGVGWAKGDTIQQTLNALNIIVKKYAKPEYQDVITSIELLNEPMGPNLNMDVLKQFYLDGFGDTRAVSNTPVVIHDAFQQLSSWDGFMNDAYANVILDTHIYQVFTQELNALSHEDHISTAYSQGQMLQVLDKWTIVGEWTGAMTDCAKYLNGYGVGARYDGSFPGSYYVGDCAKYNNFNAWDSKLKSATTRFIKAQRDTFEANSAGWIWWCWKAENAPEWNMQKLLKEGLWWS